MKKTLYFLILNAALSMKGKGEIGSTGEQSRLRAPTDIHANKNTTVPSKLMQAAKVNLQNQVDAANQRNATLRQSIVQKDTLALQMKPGLNQSIIQRTKKQEPIGTMSTSKQSFLQKNASASNLGLSMIGASIKAGITSTFSRGPKKDVPASIKPTINENKMTAVTNRVKNFNSTPFIFKFSKSSKHPESLILAPYKITTGALTAILKNFRFDDSDIEEDSRVGLLYELTTHMTVIEKRSEKKSIFQGAKSFAVYYFDCDSVTDFSASIPSLLEKLDSHAELKALKPGVQKFNEVFKSFTKEKIKEQGNEVCKFRDGDKPLLMNSKNYSNVGSRFMSSALKPNSQIIAIKKETVKHGGKKLGIFRYNNLKMGYKRLANDPYAINNEDSVLAPHIRNFSHVCWMYLSQNRYIDHHLLMLERLKDLINFLLDKRIVNNIDTPCDRKWYTYNRTVYHKIMRGLRALGSLENYKDQKNSTVKINEEAITFANRMIEVETREIPMKVIVDIIYNRCPHEHDPHFPNRSPNHDMLGKYSHPEARKRKFSFKKWFPKSRFLHLARKFNRGVNKIASRYPDRRVHYFANNLKNHIVKCFKRPLIIKSTGALKPIIDKKDYVNMKQDIMELQKGLADLRGDEDRDIDELVELLKQIDNLPFKPAKSDFELNDNDFEEPENEDEDADSADIDINHDSIDADVKRYTNPDTDADFVDDVEGGPRKIMLVLPPNNPDASNDQDEPDDKNTDSTKPSGVKKFDQKRNKKNVTKTKDPEYQDEQSEEDPERDYSDKSETFDDEEEFDEDELKNTHSSKLKPTISFLLDQFETINAQVPDLIDLDNIQKASDDLFKTQQLEEDPSTGAAKIIYGPDEFNRFKDLLEKEDLKVREHERSKGSDFTGYKETHDLYINVVNKIKLLNGVPMEVITEEDDEEEEQDEDIINSGDAEQSEDNDVVGGTAKATDKLINQIRSYINDLRAFLEDAINDSNNLTFKKIDEHLLEIDTHFNGRPFGVESIGKLFEIFEKINDLNGILKEIADDESDEDIVRQALENGDFVDTLEELKSKIDELKEIPANEDVEDDSNNGIADSLEKIIQVYEGGNSQPVYNPLDSPIEEEQTLLDITQYQEEELPEERKRTLPRIRILVLIESVDCGKCESYLELFRNSGIESNKLFI